MTQPILRFFHETELGGAYLLKTHNHYSFKWLLVYVPAAEPEENAIHDYASFNEALREYKMLQSRLGTGCDS